MRHCGVPHSMLNFLKILCEKGTCRKFARRARATGCATIRHTVLLERRLPSVARATGEEPAQLEKLTGRPARPQAKFDPAVLGGIRLDIEGTKLDRTVRTVWRRYRVRDTVIHRISAKDFKN